MLGRSSTMANRLVTFNSGLFFLLFSTSSPLSSSLYRKSKTQLQKQFERTMLELKPGFSPTDVESALRSQRDPDVALDIFRWTSHTANYHHTPSTYLAIFEIAVSSRRYRLARSLIDEVHAGACLPTTPLFNSLISFCCTQRGLFTRAFDLYTKMLNSDNFKPTMETFSLLLRAILRRCRTSSNLKVSYIYLHGVKSLERAMKKLGIIPDTMSLNMIINAYSKCGHMDQAMRVYWDMGLYGCEADANTYSYIVKGMCKEGRTEQGLQLFAEMRRKEVVPTVGGYVILACALAMDKRFDECVEVVFDMLDNRVRPDLITYKTLLVEMCREGRDGDALQLLQDFRKKDVSMDRRTFDTLLSSINL